MTAITVPTAVRRQRRPLLPLANLALAGAALTVSLVAITTEDSTPAQAPAAPALSSPASGNATGDCFARDVIVRC
jgi:hypothetical protein